MWSAGRLHLRDTSVRSEAVRKSRLGRSMQQRQQVLVLRHLRAEVFHLLRPTRQHRVRGPATRPSIDEIAARSRFVRTNRSRRHRGCGHIENDWPCDAACVTRRAICDAGNVTCRHHRRGLVLLPFVVPGDLARPERMGVAPVPHIANAAEDRPRLPELRWPVGPLTHPKPERPAEGSNRSVQ
jgi:hypothetical protein